MIEAQVNQLIQLQLATLHLLLPVAKGAMFENLGGNCKFPPDTKDALTKSIHTAQDILVRLSAMNEVITPVIQLAGKAALAQAHDETQAKGQGKAQAKAQEATSGAPVETSAPVEEQDKPKRGRPRKDQVKEKVAAETKSRPLQDPLDDDDPDPLDGKAPEDADLDGDLDAPLDDDLDADLDGEAALAAKVISKEELTKTLKQLNVLSMQNKDNNFAKVKTIWTGAGFSKFDDVPETLYNKIHDAAQRFLG